MIGFALLLAIPLTVAVHRLKKPFIYAGFDNLMTDGTQNEHGKKGDSAIWQHAKENGFVVVTLDKDFSELALQRGTPPKIIWLRCGNSTVAEVERLLAQISRTLKILNRIQRWKYWRFGRELFRSRLNVLFPAAYFSIARVAAKN